MAKRTRLNESDIHREISRSVKSLIDFTKQNTIMNVVESARTGKILIEELELQKLTNLLEASVEQSFVKGFKEVEVAIKNLSAKL